jgi:hypothetical protein
VVNPGLPAHRPEMAPCKHEKEAPPTQRNGPGAVDHEEISPQGVPRLSGLGQLEGAVGSSDGCRTNYRPTGRARSPPPPLPTAWAVGARTLGRTIKLRSPAPCARRVGAPARTRARRPVARGDGGAEARGGDPLRRGLPPPTSVGGRRRSGSPAMEGQAKTFHAPGSDLPPLRLFAADPGGQTDNGPVPAEAKPDPSLLETGGMVIMTNRCPYMQSSIRLSDSSGTVFHFASGPQQVGTVNSPTSQTDPGSGTAV